MFKGLNLSQLPQPGSFGNRKALLLIGLVIFTFFAPFLFTIPSPLIMSTWEHGVDITGEIWPMVRYVVSAFEQNGSTPLWRSYFLSGLPVVGHPLAPIFYPPFVLFAFLPLPLSMNLLTVAHLFWFGLGVYTLLRHSGRGAFAGALAAALFALAPKWIAHVSDGQWFMICGHAWWPWTIFFFLKLLRTGKPLYALALAVSLAALVFLHPPTLVIAVLCIGVLFLAELFSSRRKQISVPRLGWLAAAALIAVSLSAVQLLPLAELYPYSYSSRSGQTYTSLPPAVLISSLFPADMKYPEWYIYPGIGLAFFTLYAVLHRSGPADRRYLYIGLAGLLLSLGDFTPLYALLFKWNATSPLLRVPPRWWLLVLLALSYYASGGIECFLQNSGALRKKAALIFLSILMIYAAACTLKLQVGEQFPFAPYATTAAALAICLLMLLPLKRSGKLAGIMLVCFAEVFWINYAYVQPVPESIAIAPDPISEYLRAHSQGYTRSFAPMEGLSNGQAVAYNLLFAEGYDTFRLTAYVDLISEATQCRLGHDTLAEGETWEAINARCMGPDTQWDWLKLLNIRYLLMPKDVTAPASASYITSNDSLKLYEIEPGYGYVYSRKRAEPVTADACIEQLKQTDVTSTALVEGLPEMRDNLAVVNVLNEFIEQDSLTVQVQAEASGLLVRSESWAPGWKASIDGQPAQVYRVNCALQGVFVPAGANEVVYTYQSPGFQVGKWISLAALLLVLATSSVTIMRARTERLRPLTGETNTQLIQKGKN